MKQLLLIPFVFLLNSCETPEEKEKGIKAFSFYEGNWRVYEVNGDKESILPQTWFGKIRQGMFTLTVNGPGGEQVWTYGFEPASRQYTGIFTSAETTVKLKGTYNFNTKTFVFKGFDTNGHGFVVKYWRERSGKCFSFVTISKENELLFSRKQRNEKIE